LGCGRRLVRRPEAIELAGRLGTDLSAKDCNLGGCKDARRLDWDSRPKAEAETDDDERGLESICWEYGPGEAKRSRKESFEGALLVGVSSGIGDADDSRVKGVRRFGALEPPGEEVPGVNEDGGRTMGDVFLAYGLGHVSVKGLKLWPMPTSVVLVELFHLGRLG